MRAGVFAGLVVVLLAGCNSERSEPVRSQGARDSAIAESALPGAAGVKRALAVSDSAAARRALEDSIMRTEEP
jgi:hypothetical protein